MKVIPQNCSECEKQQECFNCPKELYAYTDKVKDACPLKQKEGKK